MIGAGGGEIGSVSVSKILKALEMILQSGLVIHPWITPQIEDLIDVKSEGV